MRKWLPLLAVCLSTFMLLVDVTIVTVALPSMATDLDTSLPDLEWVLDVYALALAALLLGVGSVADQVGRRLVFVTTLVVFALASLGCAIAPDSGTLIAGRVVQGVGAAGMYGATMALLGMHYQGKERSIAFSAWGATNAVAAAAGPVLGGVLTEYLDWRWIFLVNLPISAVAIPLSAKYLREYRAPVNARIDYAGITVLTRAMLSLTYALIRANQDAWSSPTIIALFAVAAVATGVFIVIELRHPNPVLDLGLFRRRAFTGLMAVGLLGQLAAFAYLPFSSLWMQSVLGYSAIKAGLYLLPLSGTAFLFAAFTGRLDPPPRPCINAGMALICAGALLQAFIETGSGGGAIIAGLAVVGAGVGLLLPPLSSSVLSTVPPERGGTAGGALNAFRQLGFALGIAILGLLMRDGIERKLDAEGTPRAADLAHALSSGQAAEVIRSAPEAARADMARLVHAAFASALDTVMLVVAGITAAGLVVAFVLVRGVSNEELQDESVAVEAEPEEDGEKARRAARERTEHGGA